MEGTCIWFKNTYGYLGHGIYTNCAYEGQIYVHYKNIVRKGLRNIKYRELKPGDVCEFTEGTGFFCNGTQAIKVRVKYFADNNGEQAIPEGNKDPSGLGCGGMASSDGQVGKEPGGKVQGDDEVRKIPTGPDAASEGNNNELPDTMGRSGQKDKKKRKLKPKQTDTGDGKDDKLD